MAETRRDFLKKSAVAGGLVWAAPTLATVSRAHAQGTPEPCPCEGIGTGLFVDVTAFPGQPIAERVVIGPHGQSSGARNEVLGTSGPATASVIFGEVLGCTARAGVAELDLNLNAISIPLQIEAEALTSQVSAACPPECDPAPASNILGLFINGNGEAGGFPANTAIPLGPLGTVIVNEQTCGPDDGLTGSSFGTVTTVRAVHVILDSDAARGHVIIGESKATRNDKCPCPPPEE